MSRKAIANRLGLSVISVAGYLWKAGLLGVWLRKPIASYTGHGRTATMERRRKERAT